MALADEILGATRRGAPGIDSERRLATVIERNAGTSTIEGGETIYPDMHGATVVPDGDSEAIEVLCFANVRVRPGDRVGIMRFSDSSWIVIGTFGAQGKGSESFWPESGWASTSIGITTDITNSSYEIIPSFTTNWTKEHAWTRVVAWVQMSAWCQTTANTNLRIGIRFEDQLTGTVTTFDGPGFHFSSISVHFTIAGTTVVLGDVLPAGPYWVNLVWKRTSGTGTPRVDSNDYTSLRFQEQAVPYHSQDS